MAGNDEQPQSNKKPAASEDTGEQRNEREPCKNFPVVGIGSSAGGLEALQEFFRNVPPDCGMGFVVVSHQHPGHESILPELLKRETDLPVKAIEHGARVEPDHVYVLGPGKNVTIRDGILRLGKKDHTMARDMPIDVFFRSLARDMHERAIAVVLSGTGTDGTLGIKEIKAHGGMIVAQEPSSAKYSGMPTSARETGIVDFVEPPHGIPDKLINYMKGPYLRQKGRHRGEEQFPTEELEAILRFVRSQTGHDFSQYKRSTIRRRIQRRMSVHGLKKPHEYLEFIHDDHREVRMLFSELLISVTSFFRDPEAFRTLQDTFLPELVRSRPDNHEFRVWVPGCATGEEAYSIAILLAEIKRDLRKQIAIRVFGTDLDEMAIRRARQGVYPASISVDVSPERLERYFTREGDDSYAIRKDIRDMLVFAPQNVLSDPPFVKLELLVCRNLLIYLQPELQKLLLPTFHYALSPGGMLFLGSSESVGGHSDLFETLDSRWRIYRRKEVPTELPHLPARPGKAEERVHEVRGGPPPPHREPRTGRRIERFLLNRFSPVSIIVDRDATIVYIHGRTGAYLEPEQETPRNNILEMAREGLRLPLSAAFHQAIGREEAVERSSIKVKTNGEHVSIDLGVYPITEPESLRGLVLVTISPAAPPPPPPEDKDKPAAERAPAHRLEELERELLSARESNQTMVEELQSSNEELQSSNEELQSTNEELQSSKEEMESLNEELTTVNNELGGKVQALRQSRDDMRNLLNSTDVGVIFLDQQLRVKRYTDKARGFISLRDSDIGRPIDELSARLNYDSLLEDCREVLDSLVRKEMEVSTHEGTWQLMRILPYRTSENVIGGVVITFVDISRHKKTTEKFESIEYFQNIVDTMRDPLLVLDPTLQVLSINRPFLDVFKTSPEETQGKRIYELGNGQWNIPRLRELLERILPKNTSFNDFEVEHDFPAIGHKTFLLNARRLQQAGELPELILLAMREKR